MSLLSCAILGLAIAATPNNNAPVDADAATTTKPRVLVLGFRAAQNEAALAHVLEQVAAAALAERGTHDVVTFADLNQALALEGERQAAGCDASACAAEIAGALGTELVLFGDITRIDDVRVVTVQLYNAKAARTLGRAVIQSDNEAELMRQTGAQVAKLGVEESASVLKPVLLVSGVTGMVLGAATAVAGGSVWWWATTTLGDPQSQNSDKDNALVASSVAPWMVGIGAAVILVGATAAASGWWVE